MSKPKLHILAECDLCDMLHPADFAGDCRDKRTRYETVEDYCERNGLDRRYVVVQPFLSELRGTRHD